MAGNRPETPTPVHATNQGCGNRQTPSTKTRCVRFFYARRPCVPDSASKPVQFDLDNKN